MTIKRHKGRVDGGIYEATSLDIINTRPLSYRDIGAAYKALAAWDITDVPSFDDFGGITKVVSHELEGMRTRRSGHYLECDHEGCHQQYGYSSTGPEPFLCKRCAVGTVRYSGAQKMVSSIKDKLGEILG